MITEKEINTLKKSLIFISEFPEKLHISASDYIKIHQRNIDTIKIISKERNSEILSKKISEYPAINKIEIDEFLKWKQNNINLFELIAGRLFGSILSIFKTKGTTKNQINNKLKNIAEINYSIYKIIENPYIEELLKDN